MWKQGVEEAQDAKAPPPPKGRCNCFSKLRNRNLLIGADIVGVRGLSIEEVCPKRDSQIRRNEIATVVGADFHFDAPPFDGIANKAPDGEVSADRQMCSDEKKARENSFIGKLRKTNETQIITKVFF